METILLTAYVLVWPIIVVGVLTVVIGAFVKDAKEAKREGRDII
ncbi:putative transporter small subunit [Microbacterium sp.]|nr:putative transporter small subunit [Microbacterium sp.]MCV0333741.1 putative transporter small subunit [Microbacterium sp.]MCV0375020.1 putative transporter small subunit [Microbacterium sp.]MCV0388460.1 putative transporter small subunit [Microbacterium sp.]MCV0416987.1 putative transporter small subunit [Microbacterium sp.]MCV0420298.1 putative transporter small subunit [Microbacterium sp.]